MTNPQPVYRKASLADLEQLKLPGLKSYGQFKNILEENHWQRLEEFLKDETKIIELLEISECFICEMECKLVGMAFIIPSGNPWEMFAADWSYIRMVGVDPAYGGRGIAKKLTGQCIEFARNRGERVIALHTSEFMNSARHIYESYGFKIHSELPPRFGKKYWLYHLNLS